MVNVGSQDNQINITVSSGGNTSSVNATPDMAMYYSDKAKEWATSNRIVDGQDFSSKYYAKQSSESATQAENAKELVLEAKDVAVSEIAQESEMQKQTLNANAQEQISALQEISQVEQKELQSIVNHINTGKAVYIGETAPTDDIYSVWVSPEDNEIDLEIQEIKESLEGVVNTDLSNLSEIGEKHFLGKSQITNCITEIPQRIKLELNNGTLTLKAGSEVIVPNGFEADGTTPKFDYVTVESDKDISSGTTTAGQRFVWFTLPNSNGNGVTQYCFSGNTSVMNSTAPNNYSTFYNTETNKIYRGNGTTWVERQYSLPVCLATNDTTGAFTSIDQVFNGFGYIGSTIWVDKGVKILSSDGWNNDGSYKNIEGYFDKVQTLTTTNTGAKTLGVYFNKDGSFNSFSQGVYKNSVKKLSDRPTNWSGGYWTYVEDDNKAYINQSTNNANVVMFADIAVTSTSITKLDVNTTFRAVDYNEFANTPHITQTYKNGTSWYRIWSDGWCEQGGVGINTTVALLKPYSDTNYTILLGTTDYAGGTYASTVYNRTKSSFYLNTIANDRACFWKTCGYIN